MRILNQVRIIAVALACTALAMTITTTEAAPVRAHAASRFELTPTATPGVFTDMADGPAQVSLLGNCTLHADQVVTLPAAPDQPILIKGKWRFTSADGTTTLDAETEGTGTPDPTNPSFVNIHYELKFTGGTGQMANARGRAEVDVVAMFTSATGGTGTVFLTGNVSTHRHDDQEDRNHDHQDR